MKLLVVEDNLRIAGLLSKGLEENGYEVSLAYDGSTGKKLAKQLDIDLMITDIILPKTDGIELCKKVRAFKPELLIIMLTALGTTDDKVEGFDAGADDYLVKPFEMKELIARIKALLKRSKGSSYERVDSLSYGGIEMNLNLQTVRRENNDIQLTPKEFNLLKFMLENPERVLSRTEIAEKVWDTHFDTGTNFIDVYINYLRKKVEKDFDKKLIHTKQGMGFILIEK